MTALRSRFIADMQLRGLSANTQESYVTAGIEVARVGPGHAVDADLEACARFLGVFSGFGLGSGGFGRLA